MCSAIDNATRGLINLGQLPVTCGLFFSLGHSTIVVVVVSFSALTPREGCPLTPLSRQLLLPYHLMFLTKYTPLAI